MRPAPHPPRTLGRVRPAHLHSVSVAMAKGKHPVPFRTRKLSPSAPMVLRGGPRGRVGRRRTSPVEAAPSTGAASTALPHRYPHPQHPRNEIPTGERAPDRPFRCEGTPHGRDHPASTAGQRRGFGELAATKPAEPAGRYVSLISGWSHPSQARRDHEAGRNTAVAPQRFRCPDQPLCRTATRTGQPGMVQSSVRPMTGRGPRSGGETEEHALRALATLPVPGVLGGDGARLAMGFMPGQHGQDLITAGLAGPVLAACGRMLRRVHAIDPGAGAARDTARPRRAAGRGTGAR